ncbi:integrase catalytic domain-containing protein [Trichonephila clavipes]|nr:integrase catalytic domain-containing protein [Trichonephila clavipes]
MANLPESRVCPSAVFQRTATKAVHLEVVSDLTSKAFIACLKRFVARRGKPSEIFCDQGTTFYGASRDLRKEFRQLMKEDAIHQFLVTDNITFHFNPPSAPHFGGKALTAIPQPTVLDDLRHCGRWRLLTRMTQHFWNRWSSEYLTLLQSRSKWRIVLKNLDIGDLVLIKHDNSPPLQ